MKGNVTLDEYRTGYIAETHNVSDNCARALQLFELGFTVSGATKRLSVSESTVRSYHRELMDKISPKVVETLTSDSQHKNFDIWGSRDVSEFGSAGYEDGVADATSRDNYQVTDSASQIDDKFLPREKPLAKGVSIEEIPNELIASQGSE